MSDELDKKIPRDFISAKAHPREVVFRKLLPNTKTA
jgi:hypothetical protein